MANSSHKEMHYYIIPKKPRMEKLVNTYYQEYENIIKEHKSVEKMHEINKFNGREEYLKTRFKIKPEDRYIYPVTTNMMYGWRLNQRFKDKLGDMGRKSIIKHTFYEKTIGVIPLPEYYKKPVRNFELQ